MRQFKRFNRSGKLFFLGFTAAYFELLRRWDWPKPEDGALV